MGAVGSEPANERLPADVAGAETNIPATAGESAGHRIVKNSHSPSVTSAAVAGERNTIENRSASASQTPA